MFREFVQAAAGAVPPVSYCTSDQNLESTDGLQVVRTPSHSNTGALARLSGWLSYLLVAGWKGLRKRGKPLLFIVSNPPLAPLLGFLGSKLRAQRYVLLFYDIYPDALVGLAGYSEKSLVVRLWRRLNRLAILNAERVITISPQLAGTLSSYWPDGQAARITVIPTWVDTERIRPMPKEENWFAREHGQTGKLTVLYAGNVGRVHDLGVLPEVARRLQPYPEVQFLVIGEGPGLEGLKSASQGLENIRFLPLQPEATLPFSLATGDIGVVALARGGEGVSMPSKTYYMMAAGNALLGLSSQQSDLATVIRDHGCGVNVPPDDAQAAAQAILDLYRQPDHLRLYRQQARQAALEHFSRASCVARMLDVVQPLL